MQILLTILLALMIWGPPRLTLESRSLDQTLVDPLALDGAALFQFGTWGFGALVAVVAVANISRRGGIRIPQVIFEAPTRWYTVFGSIAVFSFVYSPAPLLTLFFAGKIIIAIIVTSILLQSAKGPNPERRALDILFVVYVLQAIAITSMFFIAPNIVGSVSQSTGAYRLDGGILRDFGASFLVSGIFFISVAFFSKRPYRRTFGWIAYAISLALLSLALTRTFNLAAIAIFGLMVLLQPNVSKSLAVVVLGFGVAFGLITFGYVDSLFGFLSRDLQGIETLNGRTVAFSFLLDRFFESPILGYSFAAGGRTILLEFIAETGIPIGVAHDALSRALVDLGLVGTTIISIAVVSTCRELVVLWKRSRHSRGIYATSLQLIALMTWLLLHSVTSGQGTFADLSMPFIIVMMTSRLLNRKLQLEGYSARPANYYGRSEKLVSRDGA